MDPVQTGKYIAQLRKARGLSQAQLGEHLGVSNKTVSRWETGAYLPPADMLLAMSGLFSVTVNELLSGKCLSREEYTAAAEESLTQAVRNGNFSLNERIAFYRQKWLKEHFAAMCGWGVGITAVLAAGIIQRQSLLLAGAVLLSVAAHCWRHNSMMTYIERHAFDGTGPDEPVA